MKPSTFLLSLITIFQFTEERFKTVEEREIEEIFNEGKNKSYVSDTKTVTIAVIEHFDIVANWHKAEKLKAYFEKIHREIKDPAGMNNDTFKNLVRDLRLYDHNLRELKEFCTYGNRFLQEQIFQNYLYCLTRVMN